MAIYWRQRCSYRAQDQHRLGVAALEADNVVVALLHLRAAVGFDCHIQRRPGAAEVFERGARLWYESAAVRDEIRRREDLVRKLGQWLQRRRDDEHARHAKAPSTSRKTEGRERHLPERTTGHARGCGGAEPEGKAVAFMPYRLVRRHDRELRSGRIDDGHRARPQVRLRPGRHGAVLRKLAERGRFRAQP